MIWNKKKGILAGIFAVVVLLVGFVLAIAPDWNSGAEVNYTINEDTTHYHNLSANITGYNNDVNFTIDTDTNISWTNASGTYSVTQEDVEAWINITNSTNGNLTLYAIYDNQTGYFIIPIQATNTSDGLFTGANFRFLVNATNDAPNFTNINSTYNLSQNKNFLEFLNATDEEQHYPLNFTITFNSTNCTHASWTGRNANENCSLFNFGFLLTNISNLSALMNFTPTLNDVGVYWANLSVRDYGENYNCPHAYCNNATYKQNKTYYYSQMVKFNVLSSLNINVTDCENKIANESQEFTCSINITTENAVDNLSISTIASLRNYESTHILNRSWFYANESTTSSGNIKTVQVNVTPSKNEVGNWSVNFSVQDISSGDNSSALIYIQVDKNSSLDAAPVLSSISNKITSTDLLTRVNLTAEDNDLLIPDKNHSYGGYNETLTFYVDIKNATTLGAEELHDFGVTIDLMPVIQSSLLTNQTTAHIEFTPYANESGTYTINITAKDRDGTNNSQVFNLTILNNQPPEWNSTVIKNLTMVENGTLYLNFSQNVSDPNGDSLTFSYTLLNGESFASFNLTSAGILNFTANDSDIGEHLVNITVSDGYLTDTETFNFTVTNLNDGPAIYGLVGESTDPLGAISNDSNVNVTEDDTAIFHLYINDNDLFIPSSQRDFYNETFTINLTILNSTGGEVSLFNFTEDTSWAVEGQAKFDATFTPAKADVDNYTLTLNVSDLSNSSVFWQLNLTILEIDHNPVIISLVNQTSAINRTLYYDINSTDIEDGNDTNESFVYSYVFLNGVDFINSNKSIFNITTGVLNITFNDTQTGAYRINITVNDSSNLTDSENFWIFVYGAPTVIFPTSSQTFSLAENVTTNITFQVNHSVGDNLTYLFYLESADGNNTLKNNVTYYGNATNYTWQFTPNFTDETYGNIRNITLVVYPSKSGLLNASSLNITARWNVSINHTNAPVQFSGTISDKGPTAYTSTISVNLSSYFSDIDYSDPYYNQSVNFSVQSNATPAYISASVSSWILTLSSLIAVKERLNVTMYDINNSTNTTQTNATSNNFEVEFTTPETTTVTVTTTRTRDVPVTLKIILPDPVSAFRGDRIVLPITLQNTGTQDLNKINLSALMAKDNILRTDFPMTFSRDYIDSLGAGKSENVTLTIDLVEISSEVLGLYEITINATVKDPVYSDWGKFYLQIEEGNEIFEKLLFIEEFIASNPECAELTELVNEAKRYFDEGDFVNSVLKIDQATNACKEAISQPSRSKIREIVEDKLYFYLFVGVIIIFFAGVGYYVYKRTRLRRSSLKLYELNKEKNIKAKESI